jgi:hypothetical protein
MLRRMLISGTVLVIMVSCLYVVHAQMAGKGWKKTITLPSGEVILDMSGEWDAYVENYGPSVLSGNYPQIEKITQTGSSFTAIRMIADPWHPEPGSKSLQGELDKSGIKKVTVLKLSGPVEAKGQISEDGDKIVIDDDETVRLTLTRK